MVGLDRRTNPPPGSVGALGRPLLRPGHGVRSDPAGGVTSRRCMGGFASLRSLPTGPARRASGAFAVAGYRRRRPPTDEAGREARRRHGGGPTRGDAVTDLPLIKAAKLWAKVSARTGATYLTGRRSEEHTS